MTKNRFESPIFPAIVAWAGIGGLVWVGIFLLLGWLL